MDELKPKNFSYPNVKADLDLCENQIDALCGARPVGEATLHIPAVETDFDMQFNAALEELKAYRKTGFTPEELSHRAAPENKATLSDISVAKAIKRIEDLIGILDIRIGWGDGPADILSEKCDYELAIAALRNYVPLPENKPLTLEQLRQMDGKPIYMVDLTGGTLWTRWTIFDRHDDNGFVPRGGGYFRTETYGKSWLAYASKPEGSDTP